MGITRTPKMAAKQGQMGPNFHFFKKLSFDRKSIVPTKSMQMTKFLEGEIFLVGCGAPLRGHQAQFGGGKCTPPTPPRFRMIWLAQFVLLLSKNNEPTHWDSFFTNCVDGPYGQVYMCGQSKPKFYFPHIVDCTPHFVELTSTN